MLARYTKSIYHFALSIPLIRFFARLLMPVTRSNVEGFEMVLYPRDNVSDRQMWFSGMLTEHESVHKMAGLMRDRKALFLDIGANSGAYSLMAARTLSSGSMIIAVEPNPIMARRLKKNIELNGYESIIDVRQVAISDGYGERPLLLARGNYGEASLTYAKKKSGEVSVNVIPMVALVPETTLGYSIFGVKIDVEGHEASVLMPFLKEAAVAHLPDIVLLETTHRCHWKEDVTAALLARGYERSDFTAHGNELFIRRLYELSKDSE